MDFKGVIDLVQMKAIIWNDESLGAKFDVTDIPADMLEKAQEWRGKLLEVVVEQDDDVMMAYLEGEEPSIEDLKKCIRKGTLDNAFVPVLTGTAFKNKADPFVGSLTFARMYSGVLNKGDSVLNSVKNKKERIGRMLEMNANDRTDIDRA